MASKQKGPPPPRLPPDEYLGPERRRPASAWSDDPGWSKAKTGVPIRGTGYTWKPDEDRRKKK